MRGSRNSAFWLQSLLALALVALVVLVFRTTQSNLEQLGVQSGFDFLSNKAGFSISQHLIPYSEDSTILAALGVAILNTLLLAVFCTATASFIGFMVGAGRLSSNWLAARFSLVYLELFRNIPVLLQVFFWYYVALRALPSFESSIFFTDYLVLNNRGLYFPFVEFSAGFSIQPPVMGRFSYEGGFYLMPEFLALWAALSLYNASYISEIVRSGFASVPRGQWEAGAALGLKPGTVLRRVAFPQALKAILPPLATVYMNMFKATSLAAAIAYPEIVSVFVGTVNNLVGRPVEVMAVTLAFYAGVSFAVAWLMGRWNERVMRRGQ
ncbi:ABC transporter permease subunit [Candidatus Foliamicus sp.]